MGYTTWKVDYEKKLSTGSYGTAETLSRYKDLIVTVNLGSKKDNFKFTSTNFNTNNDNKFNPNDRITISRVVNTDTVTTADTLMIGIIQDSPDNVTYNKDDSLVKGYNYSEAIANAAVFVDAKNKTIPEALQLALVKAGGGSLTVNWDSSNPSKKRDGTTDFPLVLEPWRNWTLNKILEQYSSDKYTDDDQYYWYITKENKLRWYSKFDSNFDRGKTFDLTSDSCLSFKSSKDISEVKNHIINKGGTTPSGNPVQYIYQDYSSINKHGRKYYFNISTDARVGTIIAEDMKKSWGDLWVATKKYPQSYSFTTTWLSSITATVEGVSMVKGSTVTVASDKEYNAVVREHVRQLLKEECISIINKTKYGKLKLDISFRAGEKDWILGETVEVTAAKTFDDKKVFRIVEIQYSTTTDMFSLEEDIGSV